MADILLATLPDLDTRLYYPLGLASIAAYLESNGYDGRVEIIDGTLLGMKLGGRKALRSIIDKINMERPSVVGISVFRSTLFNAIDIMRAAYPNPDFVIGGYEATFGHEYLFNTKVVSDDLAELNLKAIVRGEGELAFKKVADALFGDGKLDGIDGITFKRKNEVVVNPVGEPVGFGDLPLPALHLLPPLDEYGNIGQIEESRGCVHECSFCTLRELYNHAPGGMKYRLSPVERIAAAARQLKDLGAYRVDFVGELALLDEDRALKIADAMEAAGIGRWMIDAHPSWVVKRKDILPALAKKGLDFMEIGIEAMNQHALDDYNKQSTPEMNEEALMLIRQNGIRPAIDFINFEPFLTMEGELENILFLGRNFLSMSLYSCYPDSIMSEWIPQYGTQMYRKAEEAGLLGGLGMDMLREAKYKDPRVQKLVSMMKYFRKRFKDDYFETFVECRHDFMRSREEGQIPKNVSDKYQSVAALPLEIMIIAYDAALNDMPGVKAMEDHYKRRMEAVRSGIYEIEEMPIRIKEPS